MSARGGATRGVASRSVRRPTEGRLLVTNMDQVQGRAGGESQGGGRAKGASPTCAGGRLPRGGRGEGDGRRRGQFPPGIRKREVEGRRSEGRGAIDRDGVVIRFGAVPSRWPASVFPLLFLVNWGERFGFVWYVPRPALASLVCLFLERLVLDGGARLLGGRCT